MVASLCVMTSCDDEKDDKKNSKGIKGTENGYAWVDLGLPSGLKWATCNVGAANPWEYGDYFAWGETKPKSVYDMSTYKWYKYEGPREYDYTIIKYNCYSKHGIVDNKDVLDLVDDAASVNMGGRWRMPTLEEQHELINNCYWEWTDDYIGKGVAGYIVYKAKNMADKGKASLKDYMGNIKVFGLDEEDEEYEFCHEAEDFSLFDYPKNVLVASYSLSDTHIFLPTAGTFYRDHHNDGNLGYSCSIGFFLFHFMANNEG